ncbi:MAG: aminopeptidase P family protein [Candidatus Heimdallarchaeota archaeon]|nr:aminopeptidase P family protein [Candidatus Heimdallarchaeota archaeon]
MIHIEEYQQRAKTLQKAVEDQGLDAFIVSESESIYYLTGATYKVQERPFFIIIKPEQDATFLVPKLEQSHMEKANIGSVISYWEYPSPVGQNWFDLMSELLKNDNNIGIEHGISAINREMIEKSTNTRLMIADLVHQQRLVKSDTELEMIRNASDYADRGMELLLNNAYYGASVLEMFSLSRKLQIDVIKTGFFDPLQTEFLTACWPAPFSAKPHGVPEINDRLRDGPLVAMSYHHINGYAAECERTFFLSEPSEKVRQMFADMEEARNRAFALIKPGVKCSDVDKAAQDYLKEKGYGEYLLHRTGHGIGLGNHEGPWVANGSENILKENMVISVEPGIYIPEIGGVRHSDTVLVTKDGYELLTSYPMDLDSLIIKKKRLFKKLKGKIVQKAVKMK